MAFCSVTDPAPLSANDVSTLPCWKRENTILIHQLNLVDNRIMRPGLPHILPFHACRYRLSEIFSL